MGVSVHFVGFRGDEYTRAVKIWGEPTFIHRIWDVRAQAEVFHGDLVVFTREKDWSNLNNPVPLCFDDSAVM